MKQHLTLKNILLSTFVLAFAFIAVVSGFRPKRAEASYFGGMKTMFNTLPHIQTDAFLIKGSVSTDKVSELFGAELSGEDYDTVAGLMLSEIGRLPRVGDKAGRAGVVFTVVNVVGKRISRVRAERLPTAPPRSIEDEES